ncbi:transcription-repair coupling factor [Buchnera aphidicola (Mindarus keteleerifoliae)]|uniref:transcription-repair coupling factor n=1 Tax=Buchnera aphidicola TaxID=9 RepID=UPI0031B6EC62
MFSLFSLDCFDKNKRNKEKKKFFLINEPVIHLEHGIGKYLGLINLKNNEIESEYIMLGYADNTKLYVPISSLHLISKYRGIKRENVILDKLGNENWKKERKNTIKNIEDTATALLDIYSRRKVKRGFSFKKNIVKYNKFCSNFLFKTTPDQQNAINSVLQDMYKPIPMDRLICGDVGFGKTEIAMRASFVATSNKKQVLILVPTTLLSQQHFFSFKERFKNFKTKISVFSRFCTKQKEQDSLDKIENGKIDILIGTHKILFKKIKWYNLGLLIIDEEHRFGVKQKELIKKFNIDIDILTLTATPIPRTLNMSINGIKDISIINTPPNKRLEVKTFIKNYDSKLVRKIILKEINRGGQVYYLFNKVKHIYKIANKIKKLVPEAIIDVGHGKMKGKDLKKVIKNFFHKKFNVLVCTTIIETGINITNVNTIIIEQADNFGLSQLHQLRGRVGRSFHQGYAWLLVYDYEKITEDAKKRLAAISSSKYFGAGLTLSTYDSEIRGSGELLGKKQSGHIKKIGISLYSKILKNAIWNLKNKRNFSLSKITSYKPEIDLKISALLPSKYISDVNTRLFFYRKISDCQTKKELDILKNELFLKFGVIPNVTKNLFEIEKIRFLAKKVGITYIAFSEKNGKIDFLKKNKIHVKNLFKILNLETEVWKINKNSSISFKKKFFKKVECLIWFKTILKKIKYTKK